MKSWENVTVYPESAETIFGNWSLIEADFTISKPGNYVYIVTKGTERMQGEFFADDLLIQKKSANIWRYESADGSLFLNNHHIRR